MEGENYQTEGWKQILAKFIGFAQMAIIGIVLIGAGVTDALGISDWPIVQKMQENKIMAVLGTFFICNNMVSACLSSGAFEIYVNGEIAYSKLKTG